MENFVNFLLTVEQKSEDRPLFQYDCSYISTDTSCWKCKTSRVQLYRGKFFELFLTVEQKSEDRPLFQYDCSYISTDTSCWKCKTSRVQFYSGEFCESYDDKVRILVWICRCEIVEILTFQKLNLFLPLMLLEI